MSEEKQETIQAEEPPQIEEQEVEELPKKSARKVSIYNKFKKIIEGKKSAAVFAHAGPDPDAIGSMMGVQWLLLKNGIECDTFFKGSVSHPQNKAVNNLLDPGMLPSDEFDGEKYDIVVLVDTVPANAGTSKEVTWDIVIDHHQETVNGNFNGLFINLKAGSCAATVYKLIEESGFNFEDDNDYDMRVATAMLVGIITDTEFQMSDDTTLYEFDAYQKLFPYRDATKLKKIINYERPRLWIDLEADAVKRVQIEDTIGVVGLGVISGKHRDVIADLAQQMVTWEDVNTSVVFALVDGSRIEGSVRSISASMSVPTVCKDLGGEHGAGGGKLGKGAYRYDLAGGGLEEEDDEETIQEFWSMMDHKETKRIFRKVKNS